MSRPDSRPRCPHCHRALRTCICSLAQAVAHQAEVLILMHPMEVHEAKGTGHLLHLCLPHSRVMVGEEFDAAELEAALHGSWTSWADTDGAPRHSLLLYPDTAEQDAALGLAAASPLPLPLSCLHACRTSFSATTDRCFFCLVHHLGLDLSGYPHRY